MSDSSKAIDLKQNNLQLELVSYPQSNQKKKNKKKVLDEEEFVKDLEKIIERDFFPDLERLRLQKEYLTALECNDLATLKDLYSRYRSEREQINQASSRTNRTMFTPTTFETPDLPPKQTPNVKKKKSKEFDDDEISEEEMPYANEEPPKKRLASDLSLDKYLATNTSEDNISFEVIMDNAEKKDQSRVHRSWLFDQEKISKEKNQLALALPDYEKQMIESNNNTSNISGCLETWSYTPKNSLMYLPEGVELTFEEKLENEKKAKIIKHENTRFTKVPFDLKKQKETLEKLSETRLNQLNGKMGIDGKELVSKETPKVNGYGYVVATPSPAPGRLAGDESPMMTWGEIDSTPFRLDGSATPYSYHGGCGPEFKIPDIPEREKIAFNLEEKANAARRKTKEDALKHVQRRLTSPSHDSRGSLSDRINVMSPAAQKLLSSKLNIRPGSSKSMSRGSATPSPSLSVQSFSPSMKLTSPINNKTPNNLKSSLSFKKPPIDSLTDNLLKLPNKF